MTERSVKFDFKVNELIMEKDAFAKDTSRNEHYYEDCVQLYTVDKSRILSTGREGEQQYEGWKKR